MNYTTTPILAQLRQDAGGSIFEKWGITAPDVVEGISRKVIGHYRPAVPIQGSRDNLIYRLVESSYVLAATGKHYIAHILVDDGGRSIPRPNYIKDYVRYPHQWKEVYAEYVDI